MMHQAIIWTNADLSSKVPSGIDSIALSQEVLNTKTPINSLIN